uniref:NADH-ubiquinone oxidoreductase chain 5 n=1 Tax=Phymatostetha sp. B13 TaxID=2653497 RepID=A0A5J6XGN2_9HEMI|nr:NADH dehydrogenase subunit 5 [Phymatostetha sp. B13]
MNYKLNIGFFMFFVLIILGIFSLLMGIYVIVNDYLFLLEWMIINLNSVSICMSIILDWMSLIFLSFVLIISSLVMYYSCEYLEVDINMKRFFYLLFLFVLSMMLLIISPNLLSILLGWDGLGLISYCLVIYYNNYGSYNSGTITFLTNRIGDSAMLMCIAWMMNYGSWHYLFYLDKMSGFFFVGFMIIMAAFTSSAQIPFSSWLPAAMAAPTPVSALVHSSTLVTAGVYILIRFNFLIYNFYYVDLFIIISLLTMIMSSVGANFEFDLKKIIALSTLSQLGFMMSSLMLGFPSMAFFHLLMHALFKALLFMCAGVVIHSMWGNQDIRFMGGLCMQMPIISSCMNISNLALCGFPFLAGYYSKDLIMEFVLMSSINMYFFLMFMLGVGLTVMYSLRLSYYSLSGDFNSFSFLSLYDCSKNMMLSIIFMVFFSVFGGGVLNWLIFNSPSLVFLPFDLKILTFIFIMAGGLIGYEMNFYNYVIFFFPLVYFFMGSMWFLPMFSTFYITNSSLRFGLIYFKLIDSGWGEYLGPFGLVKFFTGLSSFNQTIQMNSFKIYIIIFFMWIYFLSFFFN